MDSDFDDTVDIRQLSPNIHSKLIESNPIQSSTATENSGNDSIFTSDILSEKTSSTTTQTVIPDEFNELFHNSYVELAKTDSDKRFSAKFTPK